MANPMAYRRAIIMVSLLSLASAKADGMEQFMENVKDFFNGTGTAAPTTSSPGPSSSPHGGQAGDHSMTKEEEETMGECATHNSFDCNQDYTNKKEADTVDLFCQRCWLDGDLSKSYRGHCNLCCTKCEADGTAKRSESSGTTTGEDSEVTESTEASTTSTSSSSSSSSSSSTAADTTGPAAAEGMVVTLTTEDAAANATLLTLADTSGMEAGELLTISHGGNTETRTITSVMSRRLTESSRRLASGQVALDSPLQHAYPAGSAVEATPAPTVNSSTTTVEASVVEDEGSSDGPLTLVWVLLGTLLACCCIAAICFALMRKKRGSSTKKAKKSIKKTPVAPAPSSDALNKEETQPLMAVTATPTSSSQPPLMYVQPQPSVQPIYMPTYAPQAGQPFSVKAYPPPQQAPPQDVRMGAGNQYAQFMPSAYPPASVV